MDPLLSGPWVAGLLLAAGGEPILPSTPGLAGDILLQVIAGLALLLLLLIWARFLRRKKRKRKRKHHRHRRPLRHEVESGEGPAQESPSLNTEPLATESASEGEEKPDQESGDEGPGRHHSRRRRRRKDHRPRNPTLAETGGLPPRRDVGQPPTAA